MRSYKQNKTAKTTLKVNEAYEGESIEMKITRFMNNKEPIPGEAPIIYTERKEGILAAYDIRTDRFEVAIDAMDKIAQSKLSQREKGIGERTYDTMTPEQQTEFNKKHPMNKHAVAAAMKNEGKA